MISQLAAQGKLSAVYNVRVPMWSLTSAAVAGGQALTRATCGTAVSMATNVSFGADRGHGGAGVASALFALMGCESASVELGAEKSIPSTTPLRGRGIAALNCFVGRSRRT